MDDHDDWTSWTQSRPGITARVVLGIAGLAVAAAMAFIGFALIGFWVFASPFAAGVFGLEMGFPLPWIVGFAVFGVLIGATTVVAALRPTKFWTALGVAVLVSGVVVLLFIIEAA